MVNKSPSEGLRRTKTSMGDARSRTVCTRGSFRVAAAACAAALGLSGAAQAQAPSPRPDSGARGAPGVVIQYEESKGSNVLYLEEKGSLVTNTGAPVSAEGEAPATAARKAQAAPERAPAKSPGAGTRLVQRRLGPPLEAPGNRP